MASMARFNSLSVLPLLLVVALTVGCGPADQSSSRADLSSDEARDIAK